MSVPVLLSCLALGLGALFESAVFGHRAGLGLCAFYLASLLAVTVLAARVQRHPSTWVSLPWICAGAFALATARFDADVVHFWGPVLFGGCLVVAIFWTFVTGAPLAAFASPAPIGLFRAIGGSCLAFGPMLGSLRGTPDPEHKMLRILSGIALSLPLLIVFGTLFVASDPVYGHQLENLFNSFSPEFAWSAARVIIFSCLILGFLTLLVVREPDVTPSAMADRPGDALILGVSLLLVNLLFLSFLITQARYLFGGEAIIALPGWTYADYARRGFFELVAVTMGSLGVVALVYRLLHRHASCGLALALAACLIVQTGGVAASAIKRLAMYTDAYGLTVARCYAGGGLVVICVLLGLVLLALARRTPLDWVGSRAAAAVLVLLALLSQVDVEGMVVRTHTSSTRPSQALDLDYLGSLSADAVPGLAAYALKADPATRARIQHVVKLIEGRVVSQESGWPSYNVSRHKVGTRPTSSSTGGASAARP